MAATEWVEIIEPRTKEHMFANLTTGECVWDAPPGVPVKKTDDNQWWELFDQNTSRFYYYNAASQKTVWNKPLGCDIIPLAKLQTLKQNTEPRDSIKKSRTTVGLGSSPPSALSLVTPSQSAMKTKMVTASDAQTSSVQQKPKRHRGSRSRAHSTTCHLSSSLPSHTKSKSKSESSQRGGGGALSSFHHRSSTAAATAADNCDRVSIGSASDKSAVSAPATTASGGKRNSIGQSSVGGGGERTPQDRLSLQVGADRLSLDGGGGGGGKHYGGGNGFNNGGVKYYPQDSLPPGQGHYGKGFGGQYASSRFPSNPGYVYQVPLSKQRSLEGENFRVLQSPPSQDGSLSRSISFMARHDPRFRLGEGGQELLESGRRSIESTPNSARRYPVQSPEASDSRRELRHSRNSSITSIGNSLTNTLKSMTGHVTVDGFPTPMINRRAAGSVDMRRVLPNQTSESEDSIKSPRKERRKKGEQLVDSGLSTLTDPEIPRSNPSLNQGITPSRSKPERSLTSLSLQVKKWKSRTGKTKSKEEDLLSSSLTKSNSQSSNKPQKNHVTNHSKPNHANSSKPNHAAQTKTNSSGKTNHHDTSPSSAKISPLQQYILEQAKLSGYRFGDKVGTGKRDSFIDSETESHKTGDDSDAFADDEAPSSDGYEERDDISLVSTVSSVGEDDTYLTEPTYNNLDPVWAQRHGFGADNSLDIDAFSEEFDLRMRWGRGAQSSTIPRPAHSLGGAIPPSLPPSLPVRPGSVAQVPRDHADGRHEIMSSSHLSENNSGSTLSVSASIHSTMSAGTLADLENFAASNLNIQKKGIFRKKMSLKDVLSWQAESISKALTFVTEKGLKKEAVNVFKLVQIYMSDRKAKLGMTINSVAMDIAEAGFNNTNLRDEIYIQLCKQTSENPRRESLRRGWELIAICLAFFPPSETFQPYLQSFIQKHRDPNLDFPEIGRWPIHVQISHYAGICARRLERIGLGGRLKPKRPTEEEIDQSRLQIFRPSMFGGTLEETLEIQREKFPARQLPWILTTLTQQILSLNGLNTEGIFRIPADFDEVSTAKCRYDQWEVSSCSDAHVPAALLKLWLRELYIPLIPDDELYSEAVLAADDTAAALAVFEKLPHLHKLVFKYLISFLQIFARPEVASVTKMDASNLSMVFAPNFLKCPSADPIVIMENTRKEMAFVKTLIDQLQTQEMQGIL